MFIDVMLITFCALAFVVIVAILIIRLTEEE